MTEDNKQMALDTPGADHVNPPVKQRRNRPQREQRNAEASAGAGAGTGTRRRRRRNELNYSGLMNLEVPFELDPNYEYRWINEGRDRTRLKAKTVDDDWDVVSVEEGADSTQNGCGMVTVGNEGAVVRRAVGETKTGIEHSYLCRKPKDLYELDYNATQERNDRMMRSIQEGRPVTKSGTLDPTNKQDNAYIPEEGIQLAGSFKP